MFRHPRCGNESYQTKKQNRSKRKFAINVKLVKDHRYNAIYLYWLSYKEHRADA